MSRNLCQVECPRCGTYPVLDEEPRPIETGIYFAEYEGMTVANATCPLCGVRLLAWVNEYTRVRGNGYARALVDGTHVDLSYRAAFNDEPADGDVPPWPHGESLMKRVLHEGYREGLDAASRALRELEDKS